MTKQTPPSNKKFSYFWIFCVVVPLVNAKQKQTPYIPGISYYIPTLLNITNMQDMNKPRLHINIYMQQDSRPQSRPAKFAPAMRCSRLLLGMSGNKILSLQGNFLPFVCMFVGFLKRIKFSSTVHIIFIDKECNTIILTEMRSQLDRAAPTNFRTYMNMLMISRQRARAAMMKIYIFFSRYLQIYLQIYILQGRY